MQIDRVVALFREHRKDLFQTGSAFAAREILAAGEGAEIIQHPRSDHRVRSRSRFGRGAEIEFALDSELPQGFDPLVGDQHRRSLLVEFRAPVDQPLPDVSAVLGRFASEITNVGDPVD